MSRFPKNLLIIITIAALLISFLNYVNSGQSIDDLAYVMAISFDIGTSAKYKISFQLSTIESSASEALSSSSGSGSSSGSKSGESSEKTTPQYTVSTMETNSLDSAINIANAFTNKNIDLSHCKILVISEDVAKQGIKDIVNAFIDKVEIRPDCNIVVSKTPTEEFSDDSTPELEELLSKYYDVSSNTETRNRLYRNSQIK